MHYKYQFTNSVIISLPGLHEALPKMGLCSACVYYLFLMISVRTIISQSYVEFAGLQELWL